MAFAKTLYYASVLEHETVAYFLALQETKFGPMKIANPLVERLSSGQPAQSASEKGTQQSGCRWLKRNSKFNNVFDISQNMFNNCSMCCSWCMKELTYLVDRKAQIRSCKCKIL